MACKKCIQKWVQEQDMLKRYHACTPGGQRGVLRDINVQREAHFVDLLDGLDLT